MPALMEDSWCSCTLRCSWAGGSMCLTMTLPIPEIKLRGVPNETPWAEDGSGCQTGVGRGRQAGLGPQGQKRAFLGGSKGKDHE